MTNKIGDNDKGASLVEYGVITGLIAAVSIGAVANIGGTVKGIFNTNADALVGLGGPFDSGTGPGGPNDYAADVDPDTWLILTDNADVATMSGQPGVFAKADNDNVTGTDSPEIFIGGLGDDTFTGKRGSDTYLYSRGEGSDYIDDTDPVSFDTDVIELRDIRSDEVTLSQTGREGDAIITIASDGGSITIKDHMDNDRWNKIEQFVFSDITLTEEQFRNRLMHDMKPTGLVYGTALSEQYTHTMSTDGTYLISDSDPLSSRIDQLTFTDVTIDQAVFINDGADINITLPDGDVITLDEQDKNSKWYLMESIIFEGGGSPVTLANHQTIRDKANQDAKSTGTVNGFQLSDNYIHSIADDENYEIFEHSYYTVSGPGSDGYDTITFVDARVDEATFIVGSNDLTITLNNGTGDTDIVVLDKFDYNDRKALIEEIIFTGDSTNTVLTLQDARNKAAEDAKPSGTIDGTQYAEQYQHDMGADGTYEIQDFSYYNNEDDSLSFNVPSSSATIYQVGNDAVIVLSDGDEITIDRQFSDSKRRLESFIFTDVTWTYTDLDNNVERDGGGTPIAKP